MASPFSPYENATITFKVPDGNQLFVGENNNFSQSTKDVTIKCILKLHNNSRNTTLTYASEMQKYSGTDSYAFLLSGFLTDPLVYPSDLPNLAEGNITIRESLAQSLMASSNIPSERLNTGTFKLMPAFQSPYVSALKIDLITNIIGVFRVNGRVRG